VGRQRQRQCLIPVKTIFVQHPFYISGETVCCNQSWIDGVYPDTLLYADIRHCSDDMQQGGID
jgi:hypothetical protein